MMKLFYTRQDFGVYTHIVRANGWQPGNRALCGYTVAGKWDTVATVHAGGVPVCERCVRVNMTMSKVKGE